MSTTDVPTFIFDDTYSSIVYRGAEDTAFIREMASAAINGTLQGIGGPGSGFSVSFTGKISTYLMDLDV
jgi:hypothetical protein